MRSQPDNARRGFTPPRPSGGHGSGVIVDEAGVIITNHHVIQGANSLRVQLADGRTFDAELVGTDPATDVAVVRLVHEGDALFPALELADTDPRPGETVIAIGNPFGLDNSVSTGIVSATGRDRMGITDFEDFIQTDAAINPGNSGGALIDARGQLIGINTAIYSLGGSQGIGFAIPTSLVRDVMDDLEEHGRVSRGWLGVSIRSIPGCRAGADGGAAVDYVDPASPAASSGLQAGDVVVSVDGQAVTDADGLRHAVARHAAGTGRLEVVRDGAPSRSPYARRAPGPDQLEASAAEDVRRAGMLEGDRHLDPLGVALRLVEHVLGRA